MKTHIRYLAAWLCIEVMAFGWMSGYRAAEPPSPQRSHPGKPREYADVIAKRKVRLSDGDEMSVTLRHDSKVHQYLVTISISRPASEAWKWGDIALGVRSAQGRPIKIFKPRPPEQPLPYIGWGNAAYRQHFMTYYLEGPDSVIPATAKIGLRKEEYTVRFSE